MQRKMEKVRHGKHSKDKWKRTSKKRKSCEENGNQSNATVITTTSKPLVEYSDVSSEDLSGPEAGEIQSGEESIFSFSDDGELSGHSMHRNSHGHHRYAHSSRILEEEYYMAHQALLIGRSPSRRVHRIDPELIPRSPSPLLRRERKTSASSRSSRSSEVRHRRKIDSPPPGYERHVVVSPDELERHRRKKKEKRHKKDKRSKKRKKKSKHRSGSTSFESADSASNETPPRDVKAVSPRGEVDRDQLSDWEPPIVEPERYPAINKLDTGACSPVSNDSHIASPEPEEKIKSPSPRPITPPLKAFKDIAPRESPHTPPLLPSRTYNSHMESRRDRTLSPVQRERSFSPIKSPYRNPSPEIITVHSHHRMRSTLSPRRRRPDREAHRRHRKEKERLKEKRRSRSRSPVRRRVSRSPSWNRRYHSRSPSRSRVPKRYKSRSPKNIRDRDRSPSRYVVFFLLHFLIWI